MFLREKRIGYCVASEVIVLATPVYFYAMSGQMKTFIDRNIPGRGKCWKGRYSEVFGHERSVRGRERHSMTEAAASPKQG